MLRQGRRGIFVFWAGVLTRRLEPAGLTGSISGGPGRGDAGGRASPICAGGGKPARQAKACRQERAWSDGRRAIAPAAREAERFGPSTSITPHVMKSRGWWAWLKRTVSAGQNGSIRNTGFAYSIQASGRNATGLWSCARGDIGHLDWNERLRSSPYGWRPKTRMCSMSRCSRAAPAMSVTASI